MSDMMGPRHRQLGIAAVVAVALVAAGAAFAASKMHGSTPSSRVGARAAGFADYGGPGDFHGGPPGAGPGFHGPGGGDELTAAATYLGVSESALQSELAAGKTLAQIANGTAGKSVSGLVDALVAAEKTELAQAVKDGRLTQSQADTITADLTTRMTALVNGTFPRGGHGFGMGPGGGGLQTAADYLGLSVSDLLTQLRSGKTLAQVADATSGKSASGLIDALVKHEQGDLAQAVKDGRLTQSQADQIGADLKAHVTAFVNGTGRDHHGPGDHGFGPPPPSQDTPPTHI